MNTVLDRYILKHYVQTLVICFISMTGLFIVVDMLTNLDAFMASAEENGGLFQLVSRYYGYRAIAFFDKTSAILSMVAAIFTVLWLRRHNEMTAILAAGVSKIRILKPIIIASIVVTVLAAIGRESILPAVRGELLRDAKHLKKTSTTTMQAGIDPLTGITLDGYAINVADRSIEKPRFVLPSSGVQILAEKATYRTATDTTPGGFLMTDVKNFEKFVTGPYATLESSTNDAPKIIQTHNDADWIAEDELFVQTGTTFEQLTAGDQWQEYASVAELIRHSRDTTAEVPSNLHVAIHSRFLRPFQDLTLLFLGLPIILAKGGRNIFLSIGLCLGIVTLFLITTIVCQFLGSNNWTQPALAAWLPLLLFAPAAVALRGPLNS